MFQKSYPCHYPLSLKFIFVYGQPQEHGIEVARVYCIACSDANLLEKKKEKKSAMLLLITHGNKAELL